MRPFARSASLPRRFTVRNAATTKPSAVKARSARDSKPAFTPSKLIKVEIPDAIADDDITKNVTADICYPQANGEPAQPTGVVVFMHGFSQMPISYDTTIQELAAQGLFVIAPYGGREAAFGDNSVFSPKVQKIAQDRAAETGSAWWNPLSWFANLRFATQQALQQEGLQCVTYVTGNTKEVMMKLPNGSLVPLATYLPKPFKKIGLGGHSMGGGLCFSVAAQKPEVTCIGVMAPMPDLEKPFAPVDNIENPQLGFRNKTCRLLSGQLDFIVPASKVETIEKAIEASASRGNTTTYEKLPGYFHTSFEDELTLGDLPLTVGLAGALVALNLLVDSQLGDGSWVEGALKIGSGVVFLALVWLVVLRPRFQQSVARDQIRDFFNENL